MAPKIGEYPGIEVRGNSIRIVFSFRGVRCTETLKGLKVTAANKRFAHNKRNIILHEIAIGTFDYAAHFPDSKKVGLFYGHKPNKLFNDGLDEWLSVKEKKVAPSTYRGYKQKSDKHVRPKFVGRPINSIHKSELENWLYVDLNHLSNKTINEIIIIVRGVMKNAMSDQIITVNPMDIVGNLTVVTDEADPFTKAEIKKILTTPTSRIQELNMIKFGIWSGPRPSELISLAWEDIDIENWTVKFQRANVLGKYKETKTKRSDRQVELIAPAIEALKEQMQHTYMLEPIAVQVLRRDNKTVKTEQLRFVFMNTNLMKPHANETVIRARFFTYHLKKAKVRHRGPGNCRHTFASQMLTIGMPKEWVAVQLGHTSTKMIDRHYGKWISEDAPGMAGMASRLLGYDDDVFTPSLHHKESHKL